MKRLRAVISTDTDLAWERLAAADPYRAVLTSDPDRADFFRSGEEHVADLLLRIQELAAGLQLRRIMDFGCGVGRTLIPFAQRAEEVVGVDVAPTMLAEAARNCSARSNVRLVSSLAEVRGRFDLVHTYTVLQHIPVSRGMRLLRQLVQMLAEGGVAAIHVTYDRRASLHRRVIHRARATVPGVNALVNVLQGRAAGVPMMQMNRYSIDSVVDVLGGSAVRAFETDHGGHLGVMLLARIGGPRSFGRDVF